MDDSNKGLARPSGSGSREPSPAVSPASGFDPSREAGTLTGPQAAALRAFCSRTNSPWGYYASDLGVSGAACAALSRRGLLLGGLFAGDRTHAYRWTGKGAEVFRALSDSDGSPEGEKPQALSAQHDRAGPSGHRPTSSDADPISLLKDQQG